VREVGLNAQPLTLTLYIVYLIDFSSFLPIKGKKGAQNEKNFLCDMMQDKTVI
jgi:hypothetical protein